MRAWLLGGAALGVVAAAAVAANAPDARGGDGASEPLVCNGAAVQFESGVPLDWTVVDNAGDGVVWASVAGSGEAANYTGGSGDAASARADVFEKVPHDTEFDTELRALGFSLQGYRNAAVSYLANLQVVTEVVPEPHNRGILDLDASIDGGANWETLLSWNEDHGVFRKTPGAAVTVDLSSYAGVSGLMLRWRYYDPLAGDYGWYAQVDEVELSCWTRVPWGDADCSGAVSSVDALKVLRFSTALPVEQTEPCPDLGAIVQADLLAGRPMGDVDCGGAVNSVDALKVLRAVAGLAITPAVCPAIGTDVNLYY